MKDVEYVRNDDPAHPLSRYEKIRLYIDRNGNMVQASMDPLQVPFRDDDVYHEVLPQEDHRPDLIALRYYGSSQLYWVVASANMMTDPFADTTAGSILRLPTPEHVFQEILTR